MLATQGQEFWGGRLALAARTRGHPSIRAVDAAFNSGAIVRSWTMRGTIHVVPARDLAWVLSVTGPRQLQQAAGVRRTWGIDEDELRRAERLARQALRGGERLTRKDLFAALAAGGVDTASQRGYHLLVALSARGIVVQGPVVARTDGPTREQYVVLAEEWIRETATPADPLVELFVRFTDGHGPAGASDFAWWAGLPLGVARTAAASAADRLDQVDDEPEPRFVSRSPPRRRADALEVLALPPFEEYFLSYADRSVPLAAQPLASIGPGINGFVRPIILARGTVVGAWTHSLAVGRMRQPPVAEVFDPELVTGEEVQAALDRYLTFVLG